MYHFIIHALKDKEYIIEHAGVIAAEDMDEAAMLLAECLYDGRVPDKPRRVVAFRAYQDHQGPVFTLQAPGSKLQELVLSGQRGMFGVYPGESAYDEDC